MANYDIRPLQLIILEMLVAIDKVCKEHNLRYYLIAGTLLGAVRHKGFIPWDDDLDIGMPRKDYDLLIKNAKDWLPSPYEMVAFENDKEYPLPFAKIQDSSTTIIERMHLKYLGGIYMDVFPFDGMTKNPIKKRIHFLRYYYLKKMLYFVHRDPYKNGLGISSWLPLLARKLYTMESLQKKISKLQQQFDYESSDFMIDHDNGINGVVDKKIIGQPTPIEFEGKMFYGIENFHAYLSNMYGDYMQIPKQAGQRQHNFHYLDLNLPYREYKKNL